MKYFIDTEFLEGKQSKWFGKTKPTIDLISIGIVAEDGREYYAISKDFNLKEAWNRWQQRTGEGDRNNTEPRLYWLRNNVLKPIWQELLYKDRPFAKVLNENKKIDILDYFTYKEFKKLINKYGKTNKQIAKEIKEFVYEPYKKDWIKETLSEICGFNDFLKRKQPIEFYGYYADYDWVVFCWLFGKMINLPKGFPMYCIDLKQESDRIYNLKKEEYIKGGGRNFINKMSNHLDYPRQTNEHNALDDARFNRDLYNFLNTI